MERTNSVYARTNADGTIDQIVNLGTVLYNNRTVSLAHRVVPLRGQNFFTLPGDKDKYAVVNCYYKVETGQFIFDKVGTFSKYIAHVTAPALHNLLPIAQFVLHQKLRSSFDVVSVKEFSRMATFAITSTFETGTQGARGPYGYTGATGETGARSTTGLNGYRGGTGVEGATGAGVQGEAGSQGETGSQGDADLLIYLKFKADADLQPDYSLYRRDCTWSTTGIGFTGGNLDSLYTTEAGIVDNCHAVVYNGGISKYTYEDHLDFSGYTGTIQSWIRMDVPPIADFTWTIDGANSKRYHFMESSTYFPTSRTWSVDGTHVSSSETFTYVFPSAGDYVMTLVSTNGAGSTEKNKMITAV